MEQKVLPSNDFKSDRFTRFMMPMRLLNSEIALDAMNSISANNELSLDSLTSFVFDNCVDDRLRY
jgi:hypothetical protein